MKRFCSQCGSPLEPDGLFCSGCGKQVSFTIPVVAEVLTTSEHGAVVAVRDHISRWIMPLNAVVVFCTMTTGVVLDLLAPVGPLLALFAVVVALLWLAGLGMRVMAPARIASNGRLAMLLGDPSVAPWRDRRLWLTGVLAIAMGVFALASQHARAQGGLIAAASPTVQSWQQGLGLVQLQLEGINAEQRVSNVLLEQGNANTSAMRTGQDSQTSVLVDIRETLQGVPKNRMGLKATLWSEDLREARLLLDAGIKFTLVDTYQLATLGRFRAAELMIERSGSIEREPNDCSALLDVNQQIQMGGKAVYNSTQVKMIKTFCDTSAKGQLPQLQKQAVELEKKLAAVSAKADPRRDQCVAYHHGQRNVYSKSLRQEMANSWRVSRCGFERCDVNDRMVFYADDPVKFGAVVAEKCLEVATDPAASSLQTELTAVRSAIAVIGQ